MRFGWRGKGPFLLRWFLVVAVVVQQMDILSFAPPLESRIMSDEYSHQPFLERSRRSESNDRVDQTSLRLVANTSNEVFHMTWWGGNAMCNMLKAHTDESVSVHLTIPSCRDLFVSHPLGTGNWIWLLGGLRLAAAAHGRTDLQLQCLDAANTKNSLVLPWIMGHWSETGRRDDATLTQVCKGHMKCPMDRLIPQLRRELREMAISLVGLPEWFRVFSKTDVPRPHANSSTIQIELDEVAVHFRCGDLIRSRHRGYALHKFGLWARHIANSTNSIGIVTQPTGNKNSQRRRVDIFDEDDGCDDLLGDVVSYLNDRFPSARINLRNDPTETVAMAYTRLILAKHAIVAGWSTFGVYAVLSSFGKAFIVKPTFKRSPNQWLPRAKLAVTLEHDRHALLAPQAYNMWFGQQANRSQLRQWLSKDDFHIPLVRAGR